MGASIGLCRGVEIIIWTCHKKIYKQMRTFVRTSFMVFKHGRTDRAMVNWQGKEKGRDNWQFVFGMKARVREVGSFVVEFSRPTSTGELNGQALHLL